MSDHTSVGDEVFAQFEQELAKQDKKNKEQEQQEPEDGQVFDGCCSESEGRRESYFSDMPSDTWVTVDHSSENVALPPPDCLGQHLACLVNSLTLRMA